MTLKSKPSCSKERLDSNKIESSLSGQQSDAGFEFICSLSLKKLVLLEEYSARSRMKFKCFVCHTTFLKSAKSVESASCACPKCLLAQKKQERLKTKALERAFWEAQITALCGERVTLLGQYRGVSPSFKYRLKCYVCLNTWKIPLSLDKLTPCPFCSGRRKGRKRGRTYKVKEVSLAGSTLRLQGYEEQAIKWLMRNKNLKVDSIVTESTGSVPRVAYKVGSRTRYYYPDMHLPKSNRIIEVKSLHTLGILTGKKWYSNQMKAKACLAEGYKFTLLLMTAKGQRIWLPPDWYKRSRASVLLECRTKATQADDLLRLKSSNTLFKIWGDQNGYKKKK